MCPNCGRSKGGLVCGYCGWVDAVKTLIDEYRDPPTEDKSFQHALLIVANELEQALNGI